MSALAVEARKYRRQFSGMTAHIVQRASGLLLLVYLFLHVHTIHELANGPAAFDAALARFRNPVFKLLEIALFGTVILHALNGVRITLLDLSVGHSAHRRLFWGFAIGLGAVVFLAGAIPLFLSAVLGVR
jgi:succinate dehydrogenase / fumarate reductase cytochrome b subunit